LTAQNPAKLAVGDRNAANGRPTCFGVSAAITQLPDCRRLNTLKAPHWHQFGGAAKGFRKHA
jgi:hypothetical protein